MKEGCEKFPWLPGFIRNAYRYLLTLDPVESLDPQPVTTKKQHSTHSSFNDFRLLLRARAPVIGFIPPLAHRDLRCGPANHNRDPCEVG